eukprot:TRINITY_DN327_c1_g1_i1.p1 TRINITY_DN327_c1_g1~~TRINITY_DN327_c1_g1_i1.p1  ORF type:complete len:646 (-),score=152.48 TRINITY_DN327_c1_g1_i1:571-2508(-)
MGPNRFKRDKRESTPFNDEPLVREEVPPEWRDIEAPINFTWVAQDELAGMGWPKSRDQVRFCVEQGIDHLISLSPEKLPPSYAFPKLKWTLIPVEDFTGPTIADIKKFITLMDEARKEGEAIGVHCAEGRGRTGVMCACYLIYYHDIKPWDAIRIMRRQRPGSVERKTQEETVVRFWTLLQDYGKSMLGELEEKDKELRRKQKLMSLNNSLNTYSIENPLLGHTTKFFAPNGDITRPERRFQRAKSMPKFNQEEEEEINFRQHMQTFFLSPKHGGRSERRSRSQSHDKRSEKKENNVSRHERATTPGISLIENLKPVHRRRKNALEEPQSNQGSCDLTKHFKDFMSSNSSITKQKPPKHPRRPSAKGADENDPNNNNVRPLARSQCSNEGGRKTQSRETSPSESSSTRSESPSMSEDESSVSGSEGSDCSSTASSSRRSSICSSTSSEVSSRSSSPFTISSGGRSTSSDNSPKIPSSPPSFKPKYTVENVSSTTYAYYSRIRNRAAAARESRTSEALSEHLNAPPSVVVLTPRGDSSQRNLDSRFRRAQTEISESARYSRPLISSYEVDNKYSSPRPFATSNSVALDRALSSLRCGGTASNVLNRKFRVDRALEYPTPLSRDSWKRTNQRYNCSRFVSTTSEAYV